MPDRMTVQQGLEQLKVLEKRIHKQTEALNTVAVELVNPSADRAAAKARFIENAKAQAQSLQALTRRHSRINEAIVVSNATTMVTIGDEVYTVAGAIGLKKRIKMERDIYEKLSRQYTDGVRQLERAKVNYESRLDKFIESCTADKTQLSDPDFVKSATENFARANAVELVDPLNLAETLAEMNNNYDSFMSNVNSALTHSNTTTYIEVE